MKKLTNEQFIEKAKKVHGNKYNYSNTKYINSRSKLSIYCSIHGEFKQTGNAHLSGQGCPRCSKTYKPTLKEFIDNSNATHSYKYDYKLVVYKDANTYVNIICPKHGIFKQTPSAHLNQRQKCPKCAGNIKSNKEEFILKAVAIHGNKYDYSMVKYTTNKNNVDIICPKHGIFKQRPDAHTAKKCGCPACSESKGEKEIRLFLEENNINHKREYRYDECKNIKPLPFDFYIPSLNMCIEYDGIQHFKPQEVFGGIESYTKIINNDEIKTKFCKSNNIELIRISYKDNIREVLKSVFY